MQGGDLEQKVLRFNGNVSFSKPLAVFLSILGALGSCCLGLVLIHLFHPLSWWPLLLAFIGARLTGWIYQKRADNIL